MKFDFDEKYYVFMQDVGDFDILDEKVQWRLAKSRISSLDHNTINQ